jgi:hypothetical protein
MAPFHVRLFAACVTLAFLCATGPAARANVGSLGFAEAEYDFVAFADLDGWNGDAQAETFSGFKRSCEALLKRKDVADLRKNFWRRTSGPFAYPNSAKRPDY